MMFKYYISNDDTFDGAKWQDHVLVCSIVKTPTQPSLNLVGFDMIIAVHTTPPTPPHTGTLFLLEVKVLVIWNFLCDLI